MKYKKKYGKGKLYSLLAQGGKPDYLDLDKDGDKEELMREAAKQMAGGGRVYRFGGVNKYPHGGVHDPVPEARLTYKEKKDEQGRTTKLFFIDGRPASPAQAIDFFYDEIGKRGQDDFNDFLNQQKINVQKEGMQAKRKDVSAIKEQLAKMPADVRSGRTFSMSPENVRQTARTQGGSFNYDDQGDIARNVLEGLEFYRGNR